MTRSDQAFGQAPGKEASRRNLVLGMISHADAFQVLLLQAAEGGRGKALFGESLQRAREAALPFMLGEEFPSVYLEHPLIGDPSLDITVLFGGIKPGTRVDSPIAGEHAAMLDWYAVVRREREEICCGFELDTKEETPPMAGIHFQPRTNVDLVRPFCDAAGEPDRADLYLDLASRMPVRWPLSYFGLFRGRLGSPLRACGYLSDVEIKACASNPNRLAEVFDTIGFTAYDEAMLAQITTLMATAPHAVDFQFDVFSDGRLGPTFGIDVLFGIERPEAVLATFEDGVGARVMGLLEDWGVADGRWRVAVRSAFARAIPVTLDDGGVGRYAFTLMPQWVKARWTDGVLQPSKLYHLAKGTLLDSKD